MQLNDDQAQFLRAILRVLQVISAAMMSAVVTFLIVVVLILQEAAPAGPLVHTYPAVGLGIIALVAAFLVPHFVGGGIKKALVEGKRVVLPPQFRAGPEVGIVGNLLGLFQSRHIVGYAILEGAAFYGLIAYLLERQQASLIVVGLLLAAMLMRVPTRARLENWLEAELKSIAELRSLQ
jgi:hypothetical protein